MSCPSETRLQAFVDGELSPEEIAELSGHLDTCDDCRMIIGAASPVPLDDESTPDRVGRYVLRRVLGRGGMGVVYEAVDPELHRVVALKVLRSDLGALQKRLLDEAQAMAMLSHPNVVSIYDVGREGERVFIVMALVEGRSLRHWLASEPRELGAILDAFAQAAEGLRAAHAAGLVHRDFKPENVFVANDGRVLVGDFGLAMARGAETHRAEGSAAYMAPEQRDGEKVDARSDQYSFTVSLAEAVGVKTVPRWLTKLVARGTKADPTARFESMDMLLAALRAGRRKSRGRRLGFALVIGALAMVLGGFVWMHERDAPRIAECRARDAEMTSLWNANVASRTESAFRRTDNPLAERAWQKTAAVMSEYTAAWHGAQKRLCEAPRDAPALEQKKSCLTERLEMTRAVASTLEHADSAMFEQIPAMLQLLPRVSACEDAREIAQLAPPPTPEKAAAALEVKKKIAKAATTIASGRYADGLALADEAWKAANDVGYFPVLAEAYLWLGTAHGRLGHAKESESALDQAVSSASAGHAQEIAVRAWIALMHFVGFEAKRYDDGYRWADYAKAALESMPGAYELEAERLSWSRAMLLDQKRFGEALVISRQELALVELRFGASHRLTASALDGLAGVLAGQCKSRDALEPQEKACAILEKEFGSPHPQLALCLGNLAALHANLGEHARALELKKQALAMFDHVPGHPNHIAMTHRNVVRSLLELGRLGEAETEIASAAALSQRAADETSVVLLRGELHRRKGDLAAALGDDALAITQTESAEPSRRIEAFVALAETDLAADRAVDAAANAERATELAVPLYGEGSCRVVESLRVRATALVATGHATDALPLAERALAVASAGQVDPLVVARGQFAVALALPQAAHDRAQTLAVTARVTAAREGRDPKLLARIDAWLAR